MSDMYAEIARRSERVLTTHGVYYDHVGITQCHIDDVSVMGNEDQLTVRVFDPEARRFHVAYAESPRGTYARSNDALVHLVLGKLRKIQVLDDLAQS